MTVTRNQDKHRGCKSQRRWYTIPPQSVLVATCWRLCLWASKMFTRITNLDSILHKHMCCESKQEKVPTVDLQLGAHIPILRIRIYTGVRFVRQIHGAQLYASVYILLDYTFVRDCIFWQPTTAYNMITHVQPFNITSCLVYVCFRTSSRWMAIIQFHYTRYVFLGSCWCYLFELCNMVWTINTNKTGIQPSSALSCILLMLI